MFSLINIFRIVAFLEGISYLLLFSNMLFIKHNSPDLYQSILFPLGMAHGVLFMAYIVLSLIVGAALKWNYKIQAIVLLAAVIPFGTFFVEKKYLKQAS